MSTTGTNRSKTPLLVGGGVAIAVVIALLVWFFTGDEPAAVDLGGEAAVTDQDAAIADVDPDVEDAGTDPGGADAALPEDMTGTWVVDVEATPFDRATGTGTFVGYRIDEELSGIGATTAVGRTPDVSGSVTIAGTTVTAAEVTGDLTRMESDDGRRDGRVRSTFSPDAAATFTLLGPVDVGTVPAAGQVSEALATGELTVDGVTREVEVALQATVIDGRLVVAGSTVISLSDFEVTAPSAPIVLSVSDEATVEWQLFLAPA